MIKELTPIQYNNKLYYSQAEVMSLAGTKSKDQFNKYRNLCDGEWLVVPPEDNYEVYYQLHSKGIDAHPGNIVLVDETYAIAYLSTGRKKTPVTVISNTTNSGPTPQILPFHFEDFPVNIYFKDGEYYFIGKEICSILGIANSGDAFSRLDDDEKLRLIGKDSLIGITDDPLATQLTLITYPGLLRLALSSRKLEARAFQRWVTHEVLDSITKKGYYALPSYTPNQPQSLRELYESNSCLLLKDKTYHDFLQKLIMKIVGQIPFCHWEEEISVPNTYNPDQAKTRRFDLVEIQPCDRVIIWELHTQPIDKDKVVQTVLDKAYLKLAREYYPNKKVFLTFTSPEGITADGQLAVNEFSDVRFVDYRDLILHLLRLFRMLTPRDSNWRLQKEEEQLRSVIGDRPDIPLHLANYYKGVTRSQGSTSFKVTYNSGSKRHHIASCKCPIQGALIYDYTIRSLSLNKPLNFPQINKEGLKNLMDPYTLTLLPS